MSVEIQIMSIVQDIVNMYISGNIVNVSLLTTCSISVTKKLIEMSVLLIKIK